MSETQENPNRLRQRLHYIFAFILLLHCVFFLIYWIAVGQYRGEVDRFIGQMLNFQLPYVTILMVLAGMVGFWSLIRFLRVQAVRPKRTMDKIFQGLGLY